MNIFWATFKHWKPDSHSAAERRQPNEYSVWKEGVTWAEMDTRASSAWPLEPLKRAHVFPVLGPPARLEDHRNCSCGARGCAVDGYSTCSLGHHHLRFAASAIAFQGIRGYCDRVSSLRLEVRDNHFLWVGQVGTVSNGASPVHLLP